MKVENQTLRSLPRPVTPASTTCETIDLPVPVTLQSRGIRSGQFTQLELELGRGSPCGHGQSIVIDMLMLELNAGPLKETLPPDPVDPVADALIAAGTRSICLDDLLDRLDRGRPSGRFIGDERNSELGEHGLGNDVGDLSTHPEGDSVSFPVGQGKGGTHGVAVSTEHAAIVVDLDALVFTNLLGLDGSGGTGGDDQRDLTNICDAVMLNEWRLPMHTQDSDIRTVDGTAHVEAACQGNAHLGGKLMRHKVLEQFVHYRLDDT